MDIHRSLPALEPVLLLFSEKLRHMMCNLLRQRCFGQRCRANSAHTRRSMPDSGLGLSHFLAKVGFGWSTGSIAHFQWSERMMSICTACLPFGM